MLKKHVLKIAEFAADSYELKAADINSQDGADVEDLLLLKKHVLKLINIDTIYNPWYIK